MKTIFPLPDFLIAKIAAGEVIERAAYAIKELMDNSLDANSTDIKIDLEEAGLKKIIITDNGVGMSKVDLLESFKLHTTSKVKTENNLVGISTLGFRGEALSSIASISNLTINSKTKSANSGTSVFIKAGKVEKITPIGMPDGTKIMVENLFFNVPARKKFLKSPSTEMRHILETVSNFAISYPKVRFTLTHNQKPLIDLIPQANSSDRIKQLLGLKYHQSLIPLQFEDSYIKIWGLISLPQFSHSTTNKQYIFINNRKVVDKMISLAIKEAYGNLIPTDQYPSFVLFFQIPYEIVDVNVHPRKEQVSYLNPQMVFELTKSAILQTLAENNLTFGNTNFKNSHITDSYAGQLLKQTTNPWIVKSQMMVKNWDNVSQIHNLFICLETDQGMLLIDQHAAHERILYEQFLSEFKSLKKLSEKFELTKSEVLELPLADYQLLSDNLEYFQTLGFELEEFTNNTFKIISVPKIFKDHNISQLILEVLEDIKQESPQKNIDMFTNKLIQYLSCRTAIKAGEKLTKQQIKNLVEKLEQTENNYTCPHGRPTKIFLTLFELNKWFKRS